MREIERQQDTLGSFEFFQQRASARRPRPSSSKQSQKLTTAAPSPSSPSPIAEFYPGSFNPGSAQVKGKYIHNEKDSDISCLISSINFVTAHLAENYGTTKIISKIRLFDLYFQLILLETTSTFRRRDPKSVKQRPRKRAPGGLQPPEPQPTRVQPRQPEPRP